MVGLANVVKDSAPAHALALGPLMVDRLRARATLPLWGIIMSSLQARWYSSMIECFSMKSIP